MTLSYVNSGAQANQPNVYPPGQPPQWQPQQWNYPAAPQQGANQGYYSMPQQQVYGYQPAQQSAPSYSAVKIDINGATVNGNQGQTPPAMPAYPGMSQVRRPAPQYMPSYTMPPQNYAQPAPPPPPVYMPPAQPYITQQPAPAVNNSQVYNMAPPPPPPQPQQAMAQQQPMMTQPQQAQNIPPVLAPPPAPNMQPAQNQPQVPPPAIDQANNQQPQQPGQVQQPQQANEQAQVDQSVQPLFNAIKTITPSQGQEPSFAEQDNSIRTIAQYAKTYMAANEMIKADPSNPTAQQAKTKVDNLIKPLLIREKVFKGLTDVATKDTSGLSGTEKQQAEENKEIGMWTLAYLQSIFRDEMNAELAKDNIPPMSLGEVPGISQVVGNIKSDPNPRIREAGIVALREVADPDNPKDAELMRVILETAAKQDKSKDVQKVAKNALKDFQK